MGDQEEDGAHHDATDRDPGEAPGRAGGWQSGRGLWPYCHHQHHGGHRDPGAQTDRGKGPQPSTSPFTVHTLSILILHYSILQ